MEILSIYVAIICCVLTGVTLLIAIGAIVRPLPRFSLRSLFVMMALVAGFSYCIYWCRNFSYFQLQNVRAVLAEHPEIDRVWLVTNDDVQLEVEQVYFSIKGQPNLTFYSGGIDTVGKREFRKRLERALKERQPVVRPDWVVEYGIR